VLRPQLPNDGSTLIALTNYDLYPENDWNYIFGLGSTKERVGVWSMYRFGDPHDTCEKERCLMYTIKTAAHEIGHMFSLPHCAKYECLYDGANSLRELKQSPTIFLS
jgi:archaemetzincin